MSKRRFETETSEEPLPLFNLEIQRGGVFGTLSDCRNVVGPKYFKKFLGQEEHTFKIFGLTEVSELVQSLVELDVKAKNFWPHCLAAVLQFVI